MFAALSVVSQFTSTGLTQFFVQDGVRIDPPAPTWEGLPNSSEINDELCSNVFNVFNDYDRFAEIGGWSILQDALSKPMVLVMSIWADVCTPAERSVV
jgi:cellulose 1,4-beta-cellobiosidase